MEGISLEGIVEEAFKAPPNPNLATTETVTNSDSREDHLHTSTSRDLAAMKQAPTSGGNEDISKQVAMMEQVPTTRSNTDLVRAPFPSNHTVMGISVPISGEDSVAATSGSEHAITRVVPISGTNDGLVQVLTKQYQQQQVVGLIDLDHDNVYFNAESSSRTFSGYLTSNVRTMTDQDIIDYIRRSNPGLHDRIWGRLSRPEGWHASNTDPSFLAVDSSDISGALGLITMPVSNLTTAEMSNIPGPAGIDEGMGCDGPDSLGTNSEDPVAHNESSSSDQAATATPASEAAGASTDSAAAGGLGVRSSRDPQKAKQAVRLMRLKLFIQDLVLHSHILVLQIVPPKEARVRSPPCGHPLCSYHERGIPSGVYRLSIEWKGTLYQSVASEKLFKPCKDEYENDYLASQSLHSRGFYCLTCIEDLFNNPPTLDDADDANASTSSEPEDPTYPQSSLDGNFDPRSLARHYVLSAAERSLPHPRQVNEAHLRTQSGIYRTATKVSVGQQETANGGPAKRTKSLPFKKHGRLIHRPTTPNLDSSELLRNVSVENRTTKSDSESQATTDFPSNSDKMVLIREARRQETDSTLYVLDQLAYKQQARDLFDSYEIGDEDTDEEVSLKIKTPIDLPPPQERYKKQGLTPHDARVASAECMNQQATSQPPLPLAEIYCYSDCGETGCVDGIVRCNAEYCLVGSIHLRCSGLDRLPCEHEEWYCKQCSPHFGPGTVAPLFESFEDTQSESEMSESGFGPSWGHEKSEFYKVNFSSEEGTDDDGAASLSPSEYEMEDLTYTLPVTPPGQIKNTFGVPYTHYTPFEFLDGPNDVRPHDWGISMHDLASESYGSAASPPAITATIVTTTTTAQPTSSAKRPLSPSPSSPQATPTEAKRPRLASPILPSRSTTSGFGHLAAYVVAETRNSAAALSDVQIHTLEAWKSTITAPTGSRAGKPRQQKQLSELLRKTEEEAEVEGEVASGSGEEGGR